MKRKGGPDNEYSMCVLGIRKPTCKEAEEFFHTEKLLQLLREHKEGKKDNSRKIWTVLAFLIWHHTFFYKESSERQLQSN